MYYDNLPVGMSVPSSVTPESINDKAKVTEAYKEKVLMECRAVDSQRERKQVVDSMLPDGDIADLLGDADDFKQLFPSARFYE